MAKIRSIVVPSRFHTTVSAASPEALLNLSGYVRGALDNRQDPTLIAEGLEKVGWPSAFAEWFVRMTAAGPEELDISPTLDARWAELWPIGNDILALVQAYKVAGNACLMWLLGLAILILQAQWLDGGRGTLLIFLCCQLLACAMAATACVKASRPLGWSPAVIILVALLVNAMPFAPLLAGMKLRENLHTRLRRARIKVGFFSIDEESVRKAVFN